MLSVNFCPAHTDEPLTGGAGRALQEFASAPGTTNAKVSSVLSTLLYWLYVVWLHIVNLNVLEH
jgi:hypothetical protein